MILDRKNGPSIQQIGDVHLPKVGEYTLRNGIQVYEVNQGEQAVLKVELVFKAGRPSETKRMVSKATALMLREGTHKYTSKELAEIFDFYGASFSTSSGLDTASITLHSMCKHFDRVLPMLMDVLNNAVFPETELEKFKTRGKQRLLIDLAKNDVRAYRTLTEKIYGSEHVYGYNSEANDFDQLTREDLIQHFNQNYHPQNCIVLISGQISDKDRSSMEAHLGQWTKEGTTHFDLKANALETPKLIKLPSDNTYQSAIRMGSDLFDRRHPDFSGMYFMTTLFGGFFSSRLMSNIREDKGYTYNIYAGLDMMIHEGYFYISTEVGNEHLAATMSEITKEVHLLQNELASDQEMETVRNYLLGNYLTYLDGAFNVAQLVKTIILSGSDLSYFDDQINIIKDIQPEEINRLANEYLNLDTMWKVVVGNT